MDDFSFAASNWGKSKFIGLQDIAHLTSLTFVIELEIMNETPSDRNDDEIWDETQIDYTLSLNEHMDDHNVTASPKYDPLFLENSSSGHSATSPRSSKSSRGGDSSALKKEVKSLKKQMVLKDKAMEQMALKLNGVRAALKEEIQKRGDAVGDLGDKMSVIEQYVLDDEKRQQMDNQSVHSAQQINSFSSELQRLKNKVTELQSAMDHRGGKKMDESTKREQLKQWLIREADLPQYLDHLTENGFEDVKSLKDLTKEYMDQIGIDKIGHQLKLLRLIRKMNGNNMVPEYSQHIMSEPPGPPHSHHVVQPPHLNGYASSYHGHEHQDEMYNGTGSVATSVTYHEGPYSGQFSQ